MKKPPYKTHLLKTDTQPFHEVLVGQKTAEYRLNDRDFRKGDLIILMETRHTGEAMAVGRPLIYTGRILVKVITHLLQAPAYGFPPGFAMLSLGPCGYFYAN